MVYKSWEWVEWDKQFELDYKPTNQPNGNQLLCIMQVGVGF